MRVAQAIERREVALPNPSEEGMRLDALFTLDFWNLVGHAGTCSRWAACLAA